MLMIKNNVQVNGKEIKEVRGGFGENQKCILATDIAEQHGVRASDLNVLIRKNIGRFNENDMLDFLSGQQTLRDFAKENGLITSNRMQNIFLFSERGYIKLVAMMDNTNDKKWEVMDVLTNNYFRMEEQLEQIGEKERLLLGLFSNDYLTIAQSHKALVALETKPLLEKIEEDTPKVNYYERILHPSKKVKMLTTTEIAKDLGMSAIALNKKLNELGVQYKQGGTWFLYSKYQDRVPEYADYDVTDYGQTLKWTEQGREFVVNLVGNIH